MEAQSSERLPPAADVSRYIDPQPNIKQSSGNSTEKEEEGLKKPEGMKDTRRTWPTCCETMILPCKDLFLILV